jgi:hypothetical protein
MKKKLSLLYPFLLLINFGIYAQVSVPFNELKVVTSKNDFLKLTLSNGFELVDEDDMDLTVAFDFNDVDSTAKVWAYYNSFFQTFTFVINGLDYYELNNQKSLYHNLTNEIKKCNYVRTFIEGVGYDGDTYMLYSCPTSKYKGKIGFCLKTEDGFKVGKIKTFTDGYIDLLDGTRE